MAANTPVWGIDIGQCALKALRLRQDPKGGVQAIAFDYIEHPKILSQPDADPDELIAEALRQFMSRNEIEGDRVAVSVPAQQGLARFIQLPPVEQKKIPEIVKYEARQQIPFALEEVIWDYQVIGGGSQEGGFALDTEVGLFAMKRDQIDRLLAPLLAAGLDVELVQMSPLALYNFFAFDQLGIDPGAQPDAERGSVVILDVGADHTDLVITNGVRIWQRNVPLGGNHFTRALSKDLKLTFAKAEHLKRNATKAPDPRRVFQAMRPVFADFATEVQRSIGYFASVHRESRLEKIVGVGNGFKLPGLQKYLQENLQQPVEKLDSYARVTGKPVLEAPAFRENRLGFPVCYGLGLQALGLTRIHTTLLPSEIVKARVIRRKKPWAAAIAAGLLLCLTVSAFGAYRPWRAAHENRFRGPEQEAEQVSAEFNRVNSALTRARSAFDSQRTRGEGLVANVENRLHWLELLRAIERCLPRDQGATPENLAERAQINIVGVSVERWEDLSQWYPEVVQRPGAYERFAARDQQSMPQGEGWVVTLLGHHYHHGSAPEDQRVEYVQNTLLANLHQLQVVDAQGQSIPVGLLGISHATILDANFDQNYEVAAPGARGFIPGGDGAAAAGASQPRSSVSRGPRQGTEPPLSGAAGSQPPLSGSGGAGRPPASGRQRASGQETQLVPRTDFMIQFVWRETSQEQREAIVASLVNDLRSACPALESLEAQASQAEAGDPAAAETLRTSLQQQLTQAGASVDAAAEFAEWVAGRGNEPWTDREREQVAYWWWGVKPAYPSDWTAATGLAIAPAPEFQAVGAAEQSASGTRRGDFGSFGGASMGGFGGHSSPPSLSSPPSGTSGR